MTEEGSCSREVGRQGGREAGGQVNVGPDQGGASTLSPLAAAVNGLDETHAVSSRQRAGPIHPDMPSKLE